MSAQPADAVPGRSRDADRTRAEILAVATTEFADSGYAGARVDVIAAKTRTTKRMIYYYFGSKEGLYVAALEAEYTRIRSLEQSLDVEHLDPVEAIRELAAVMFDHHEAHPDFIRLVVTENIHYARHISTSAVLSNLSAPAVDVLGTILQRGRDAGVFRSDLGPLDLHQVISAFCVYRVANRYTFRALFGRDMLDPAGREHQRRLLGDLVVATLSPR